MGTDLSRTVGLLLSHCSETRAMRNSVAVVLHDLSASAVPAFEDRPQRWCANCFKN